MKKTVSGNNVYVRRYVFCFYVISSITNGAVDFAMARISPHVLVVVFVVPDALF